MGTNSDLEQYPKGQIKMGGALRQVTDVSFDGSNGAKVVSTLRQNPSGVVMGNKAVAISGNSRIDSGGPEINWYDLLDSGALKVVTFQFPGGVNKTCTAAVASLNGEFTNDDGVWQRWTMVGWFRK